MLTWFCSGRADWVWLDEKGKSTIYINQRGSDKSLIPHWVKSASSHGGGFTLDDGGPGKTSSSDASTAAAGQMLVDVLHDLLITGLLTVP